ncbi:MAG TPA: FHA domain-containing protein [Bryobacteraceae bacterium]|nr:FHA domain-containing protein [Bryobacteraceae bacterium]
MAGKAGSQFEPVRESVKPAGRKSVMVADQPKPPVVGWCVVLAGPQKGEDFRIREGPNIIGSAADADIVLHDPDVSEKHASLRYKDRKFTITDLDSANGTFVNDRPDPIAREELKDNDTIRMGTVTLKFKSL